MSRFQFSLRRLLLTTGWLCLTAAAAGQIGRIGLNPNQKSGAIVIFGLIGVCWAGITGAVRTMTSPQPVRNSFYMAIFVLVATAVGIVTVAILFPR